MKKSITVTRVAGTNVYIINKLVNCYVVKLAGKLEPSKIPPVNEYRVGELISGAQLSRIIDGEAILGIEVIVLSPK